MLKRLVSIVLTAVFLVCALTGCVGSGKTNSSTKNQTSFDDNVDWENVTAKNFLDQYYLSMLYPSMSGNWSQSDITYLLTKYIEKDIEKNKSDSIFDTLRNSGTPFFYTVDTSTGKSSISFLVLKSGELNNPSNIEFMTLMMFVADYGEKSDDLDSYEVKVYTGDDVVFNSPDDFLAYLNAGMHNRSVFFERGWLKVK